MLQIQMMKSMGRQMVSLSSEESSSGTSCDLNFREQMLLHNTIEGMLACEIVQENDRKICKYVIENKVSLKSFCEREKPNAEQIKKILGKILATVMRGHEFMLLEDDFVLDTELVFLTPDSEPSLIYFSGYGKPLIQQLCELAEFLMNTVDYRDEKAVLLVYSFYMKTKEKDCCILTLLNLIKEKTLGKEELKVDDTVLSSVKVNEQEELQRSTGKRDPGDTVIMQSEISFEKNVQKHELIGDLKLKTGLITGLGLLLLVILYFTGIMKDAATGRLSSLRLLCFTVCDVIICTALIFRTSKKEKHELKRREQAARENSEPTVLLNMEEESTDATFSLVSDEYATIEIKRFPYYIGKDKTYSDTVLSFPGVSRYHLKIDKNGGDVVISDLNSTNGTYLNGVKLTAHTPVKVRRGDEVRIANCVYYCN